MKAIDEQIEEAQAERDAIGKALDMECRDADNMNALNRLWLRAVARLTTLEAVRDGRMIPVYATACVDESGTWRTAGLDGHDHDSEDVMESAGHERGDAITVLRGYALVPSTQVHEVEAEVE